MIADDHALFRDGMQQAVQQLADTPAQVQVIEAVNWQSATQLLTQHPDLALALVDLNMPGMPPFAGLKNLLDAAAIIPVVVVSASENLLDIKQVLDAGAMGYVGKNESPKLLIGALRLVLAGGVYVPPILLQHTPKKNSNSSDQPFGLTPRQYEVLKAIARGMSTQDICDALCLSPATVKAHLGAIYKTLQVSNREEAVQVVENSGKKV